MQKLDFSLINPKSHFHFIGIGGISMSALASILISKGYMVSGSDRGESKYTKALGKSGARIYIGHQAENVSGADVVIYTAAIGPDNPERLAAQSKNIPCFERSALLGAIEKMYKYPIDVSGTHGKTSTTGMLAHIFYEAKKNPTVLIGGELNLIDGNMHIGSEDYFVSEACEYHRSFLDFSPHTAIILNIETDHLDYYKDLADIKSAFADFAKIASGNVIINADDENTVDAVTDTGANIVTVSSKTVADIYAKNIQANSFCEYSFDVYSGEGFLTSVSLGVSGRHHVNNALCAFAAAYTLGLQPDVISRGLHSFHGVKRRFELKGSPKGIRIYDDYAHHPTEIMATLQTIEAFDARNKYILFQPHTYTRTYTLFDDFITSLSGNLNVIITDIYAAREKDNGKVSSKILAEKISNAVYIPTIEEAAEHIISTAKSGDLVMTVGAGDIYKAGEYILEKLAQE